MSITVVIADNAPEGLPTIVADIIDGRLAADPAAHVIHQGRNRITAVDRDGMHVAVKEFGRSLKNSLIYALRPSKACKSYHNAGTLLQRGIPTPRPLAYIEERAGGGLLRRAIYISAYDDTMPLADAIGRYGDRVIADLGRFVARLHTLGIRHDDLNNTNIRVTETTDGILSFSLIDLNRMRIYPDGTPVPMREAMANICRFSAMDHTFDIFVDNYIAARGLPPAAADEAYAAKRRHDRRTDRKRAFKRIIHRKK